VASENLAVLAYAPWRDPLGTTTAEAHFDMECLEACLDHKNPHLLPLQFEESASGPWKSNIMPVSPQCSDNDAGERGEDNQIHAVVKRLSAST
jgi:hypothetical protein